MQDPKNMTKEQLIEAYEKAQAELQAKQASNVHVKMTEKGGISVYGLQRFPVTLYAKQWETLFSDQVRKPILSTIENNREELEKRAQRSKAAKEAEKAKKQGSAVAVG